MQTSKFLLAIGALAAVILLWQVQAAPDNAEQAKMREALRQLMGSNPPQNVPATAVVPAGSPVVSPAQSPVVPPATRSTPVFGPVPPPSQPGVAPVIEPAQPAFVAAPPPVDEANLERARELMRQKLKELPATTAPSIAVGSPSMAYTAIQAPPSPLSPAQQTKLADLLVRYKADTITAQEYHAQRAAILAGH